MPAAPTQACRITPAQPDKQDNDADRDPNFCAGAIAELLAERAIEHRRTQPNRR